MMRNVINRLASTLRVRGWCALLLAVAVLGAAFVEARAADLLIADRLGNGVYRYSESGEFLGIVTREILVPEVPPKYLYQPTGIAISPDYAKLYVSSSQLNQVVAYDYDRFTGTAANPTIFAGASDGISFPNDIQFSPDGSTIYVANLNGGVSRFNLDGSSAGAALMLPTVNGVGVTQASSMDFTSDGRLLAGAFSDPSGAGGGVAISNAGISAIPDFLVEPTPSIRGATGLMVHDDYLYVSGLFTGSIRRFSLGDGEIDSEWVVSGPDTSYPQDLVATPDGNGFLAGILGFLPGAGRINRYAFDGTPLGTFAVPAASPLNGFREATALVFVPTSLVGDYNDDGTVDARDYTVWRDSLGSANSLPNDETPGVVDASDYDAWKANFGLSAPAGAAALGAATVPEPASVMLMGCAILAGSAIRKRN